MKPIIPSLLVLALVGGCAGSETGNGFDDEQPVGIELHLLAGPDGTYIAPDRAGVPFELTDVAVRIDRIDFVLTDGAVCVGNSGTVVPYEPRCGAGQDRVRVEGPWAVDLVTGATTPSLEELELPSNVFDRIEARLAPNKVDDWTINASGLQGARSFRVAVRLADVVRFEGPVSIDDMTQALELGFEPGAWFAELDLARCMDEGGVPTDAKGVFLLDQASVPSCGNVESRIAKAFRESTKLAKH